MFVISEPATQKANSIVEGLSQFVTGVIQLKKENQKGERSQGGMVSILPNVGHTEGQFTSEYRIEPYKGVTTDFSKEENSYTITSEIPAFMPPVKRDISKHTKIDAPSEPYAFSNVYNYNDFLLILNNQIALYKSTGQIFNLISFKLDPNAQIKGLLSINQLQNSIKQATNKKDKICVIENKVIVLLVRGNLKSVVDLMSNVQGKLPSQDQSYLRSIYEFISIFNTEVDERVDNAESMMEYVLSAENTQTNAYQPINKFIG